MRFQVVDVHNNVELQLRNPSDRRNPLSHSRYRHLAQRAKA
jgi:hypothetical protein